MGREAREGARRRLMLRFERELWRAGIPNVAGVDEVGVGPLAGPVVAAAVVLSPGCSLRGLDDSKRLTDAQRRRLAVAIRNHVPVGVGIVGVEEVDRLNVYRAALEAMRRAVANLPVEPGYLLVDARTVPDVSIPQRALVKGDQRSYAVAAASIVAKVFRDDLMCLLDARYPGYGFARHKGYATRAHFAALARYGPCPEHRRSWRAVRQLRLPGC